VKGDTRQKSPSGDGDEARREAGKPYRTVLLTVAAIVVLAGLVRAFSSGAEHRIVYSKFLERVAANDVTRVDLNEENGLIDVELKDGTVVVVQGRPGGLPESDVQLLEEHGVKRSYHGPGSRLFGTLLTAFLPIGLLIGFFWFMSRRMQGQMSQGGPMAGAMAMGRSRAKVYTTEKPKTTFGDVAGYGGVKEEITEVVDFLKHPEKFKDIGARIPKGVLLVGPPGTGKTLLARAVAGEAGVPFITVTGSDFMEMFVGVGAARVRDLFQTARKQAPAILFVDELDSIGRRRGVGIGGGGVDEREGTLNQMLSEMDGFEATEGVVMIAATNRPDILDPALLRPGRFDRQIMVPLPTLEERRAILKVHCRDKRIAREVDLDMIARGTPGMSGADLANLVNESALFAVRREAQDVEARDFDAARDRVLMGLARDSMVISENEKEVIAFHEGGHAVLAYLLEHADPLHKVTILPTGMALGVTQQLPLEEKHIHQKGYIEDSLAVRLGGRVAEELIFGVLSTGATNDLMSATETAHQMVREWGMSDRIGPRAWGSQGPKYLGEGPGRGDYSEHTAQVVDDEVERLLRVQEERAREVLQRHKTGLQAVARALLEQESLSGTEVGRLIDAAVGDAGRISSRSVSSPVSVAVESTREAQNSTGR
jgi:cell division protease FtsH